MRWSIADFVILLLLAALAGVAASGGYLVGAAKVETLRTEHARALFAASQNASRALYAAQQRGDALTLQLAAAGAAAHQITQERQHDVAPLQRAAAFRGPQSPWCGSPSRQSGRRPWPLRVGRAPG